MDDEKLNSQTSRDATHIGPHLVASGDFIKLYTQGMALIEEVAAYLDGEGRSQARGLNREAGFLYATESMRLTTRLMQLASWLLLQRAVQEKEMSAQSARAEKSKVKFSATPSQRGGPGWSDLPEQFLDYIAHGDRLFERVVQFDILDRGEVPSAPVRDDNDIADQMSRLRDAFGSGDKI
ncbi:MAG: DUF1465 family protein [Devosiaceae bacterium]|nr:DUF1465 family protein [Devosiaceae bacterium]